MTQEDGMLPLAAEIRQVLGRAKLDTHAYVQALTAASVGMSQDPSIAQRQELLAILSEAHADLLLHVEATQTILGLPYVRVLEAYAEAI